MRSWDKYCEDTEKAFVHFRACLCPFIIPVSENDKSRKRCKLFI